MRGPRIYYQFMNSKVIDRVTGQPAFLAFSSLVGLRILGGDSLFAFRMLVAIGSPPLVAHNIIEGWILHPKQQRLVGAGLSVTVEAACRFAHFIGNFEKQDWAKALSMAVRTAAVAAADDTQRDSV